MREALRELWRYRGLLYAVIDRDIKIKYKQSVMGFMWAILMPLVIVLVGVMVRYAYALAAGATVNVADVAGVAIRSVPWAFTVSGIRFATNCLISNSSLVTKIYFPKEIFPMAAVGSSLFDLCVAAVPLILLVAFSGIGANVHMLWVPAILVTLLLIVTGLAFLVSAASLFYRDVKYLVEVALTFGIFVTPVFFNVSMFGKYGVLMMLNPVSGVLEALDAAVVRGHTPDLFWLAYSFVFGAVAFIGGYMFFKRLEPAFAESI
jgi:ABC-type polysaccharide/polyol phosphate export permease